MANTEIITYRARNRRLHQRTMKQKLRAIQSRHPDARIVSVDVSRRSALQWAPAQLDVTMVVEWGNTAPGSEAVFVGEPSTPAGLPERMLGASVSGGLPQRILQASVAKFKSLSTRNKALVIGGFIVLMIIGSLSSEEETTPARASVTSTTISKCDQIAQQQSTASAGLARNERWADEAKTISERAAYQEQVRDYRNDLSAADAEARAAGC